MHNFIFRPGFRFLQLFAEGGGEGGTGAGTTGPTEAAPVQPQFKGAKNPLADVQYGTNAEPAAAGQDSIEADDRAAQFEALIKGEYKDLYEDRLKDTISKRLKGTEETVRRYDALSPVLGLLAQKYGVDANDAEALSKAIEDDETFYEDEALEKGMTVQQVKDLRKMQRENAELKRQMEERQSRERAEQDFAQWMQEAEQVKQIYPSFDLKEELQNPNVRRYLMAGVPLKDVYEQTHLREIISGSMQYSANRAAEKVAKSVASGMRRPAEGAMGSQAPVVSKRNVSQLTRADREEILRRAERGEKIGFD